MALYTWLERSDSIGIYPYHLNMAQRIIIYIPLENSSPWPPWGQPWLSYILANFFYIAMGQNPGACIHTKITGSSTWMLMTQYFTVYCWYWSIHISPCLSVRFPFSSWNRNVRWSKAKSQISHMQPMVLVYLPTWLGDFVRANVGTYSSTMEHMGFGEHRFTAFFKMRSACLNPAEQPPALAMKWVALSPASRTGETSLNFLREKEKNIQYLKSRVEGSWDKGMRHAQWFRCYQTSMFGPLRLDCNHFSRDPQCVQQ